MQLGAFSAADYQSIWISLPQLSKAEIYRKQLCLMKFRNIVS